MAVEAAGTGVAGLELVGLRRRFGDVVALDELSFSVAPGRLFGFVGRNGPARPPRCASSAACLRPTRVPWDERRAGLVAAVAVALLAIVVLIRVAAGIYERSILRGRRTHSLRSAFDADDGHRMAERRSGGRIRVP